MPSRVELANALRALAIDAIEKSKSGHPGAPLGMAQMGEVLWCDFLKHNPTNPNWYDRDRFILSNGHASMLLYGLLHLTGYAVSMDDIAQFRQFGSATPGHPEHGRTPGVEISTGPLGQGLASAVGFAIAERALAETFNKPNFPIVDHFTYVFVGDGCLMEGISQEAISLAGTLGLGKLIVLYDDNGISIDGAVSGWFRDNTPARFASANWHVTATVDGNDVETLQKALAEAKAEHTRPSLIPCKTTIGFGSPHKAGSASCHGSPLGAEEAQATKDALGWKAAPFTIPADIAAAWDMRAKGAEAENAWNQLFAKYKTAYPDLAAEFTRRMEGKLPVSWAEARHSLLATQEEKPLATRVAGKNALDALAPALPGLMGGSADLTGSVGTWHKASKAIEPSNFTGNYIYYGVREFAMGAAMNGLTLHGGFIPYGATFLVFSDYARSAIRLAALMQKRVVWVLTHDSIGVGEDGPTHQPVEQVPSLRLIPGLDVWRPCDSAEANAAWIAAIERENGPSCLIMSRQNLPQQNHIKPEHIFRGGYILWEQNPAAQPAIILLATGSEVQLAMEVGYALSAKGISARVVSMPCLEAFERQDAAYKEHVLPASVRPRLAIEAAASGSWHKYVGLDGDIVCMSTFGESAPADKLFEHFGFTVEHILKQALMLL